MWFVATRVLVVAAADGPKISPDEAGSWAIARWIAGAPGTIELGDMPVYPVLPGGLLAPLWWLPVDPASRYRLALVLLGLVSLCAALLVQRTLRRLGADDVMAAAGLALVLLVPSTTFGGTFTYAEPTVLLWWALLFWGVVAASRTEAPLRPLLVTSLVAGSAALAHGRLVVVPVLWVLHLLVRAAGRDARPQRGRLAAAATLTIGVAALGRVVQSAARARLWREPEPTWFGGGPSDWVLDPGYWWTLATTAAGQLWYVLAATGGLAAFGALALVEMVRRPTGPPGRAAATTLSLMLLSNVAVSSAVMAGFLHQTQGAAGRTLTTPRWDHLLYGRYNDAAAIVLAALGLWWIARRASRRQVVRTSSAAVMLLVLTGGVLAWRVATLELDGSFPTPNAAALTPLTFTGTGVHPLGWTLAAVALVVGIGVAALRGRTALLVVVGAWLVLGGTIGAHQAVEDHRFDLPVDLVEDLGPGGDPARRVLVADDLLDVERYVGMGVISAQVAAVDQGWRTELVDRGSEALAARPGDADALVLAEGVAPAGPGWEPAARHGDVRVWQRR